MKLKPADLKTRQEAEHRMIDGEVFKREEYTFCYIKEQSRFAKLFTGTVIYEPISANDFARVTEWQVEVPRTWEDDVREGKPILCDVTRRNIGTYTRKITQIDKDGFYIDDDGVWWESATPVTPDDPAIYKGEK